jgi:hypothetical protein
VALIDSKRRNLVYVSIGLIEWIGLMAVEARHNPNYLGDPYAVAIFVTAFVMGILDGKTSHRSAGILLIAPALCLAGWTTPRGDNDGLWTLIFPMLVFFMFLAGLLHNLGDEIRKADRPK